MCGLGVTMPNAGWGDTSFSVLLHISHVALCKSFNQSVLYLFVSETSMVSSPWLVALVQKNTWQFGIPKSCGQTENDGAEQAH